MGTFQSSSPKPTEFSVLVLSEVVRPDGLRRMKPTNVFRAPAIQWPDVKQSTSKSLAKVIDKEGSSNIRPYA